MSRESLHYAASTKLHTTACLLSLDLRNTLSRFRVLGGGAQKLCEMILAKINKLVKSIELNMCSFVAFLPVPDQVYMLKANVILYICLGCVPISSLLVVCTMSHWSQAQDSFFNASKTKQNNHETFV